MADVGVRDLRNNLSKWLREVANGEELVITDRGRPIARLISSAWPSALEQLIAAGEIGPPRRGKGSDARRPTIKSRGSVSDLVADQRR
jgi:prevent-host-death family protein